MDVSADLTELGRTPVAVVSAGIKSVLDVPRTLEYLETQGVCVAALQSGKQVWSLQLLAECEQSSTAARAMA